MEDVIQRLEQEFNILFEEKVIPSKPDNTRMHVEEYMKVLDQFIKPANNAVQAALKEYDSPEFRHSIRNLIYSFRQKIFEHYNNGNNVAF